MLRVLSMLFFVSLSGLVIGQDSYEENVDQHRKEKDSSLRSEDSRVFLPNEKSNFTGLNYYDADTMYRVTAKFKKKIGKNFEMPTTTSRTPIYRKYGRIEFKIDGERCRLWVYQPMVSMDSDSVNADYLFVPFRDSTNKITTYGGGRYLDLSLSDVTRRMIVDFNFCYNPYCSYSHRFSCPITPRENTLNVWIKAGEKQYENSEH